MTIKIPYGPVQWNEWMLSGAASRVRLLYAKGYSLAEIAQRIGIPQRLAVRTLELMNYAPRADGRRQHDAEACYRELQRLRRIHGAPPPPVECADDGLVTARRTARDMENNHAEIRSVGSAFADGWQFTGFRLRDHVTGA